MLRVASFSIEDAEGMNALLEKYRLASGAHILVSEGKVCIPYEDGHPPTKEQQICTINEQRNMMAGELSIIKQSQMVLEELQIPLREKFEQAESTYITKPNDKQAEKIKNEEEARLNENIRQIEQNNYEIKRIEANFKAFDNMITELSSK